MMFNSHQTHRLFSGVLAGSLLLNVYLLFFHGGSGTPVVGVDSGAANAAPSEITVSEGGVAGSEGLAAAGAPATDASSTTPGGPVLDAATGLKYLNLEVNGSLAATFSAALGREEGDVVSAVYARLFMWKVDLRNDVYRGDRIQLLYRPLPDGLVEIPAATYESKKHRTTFQAYYFQAPGQKFGSWYDETGKKLELQLVKSPIAEYEQITALLKDRTRHNGMDFKAPVGVPLVSPFSGTVTRINWKVPNGTCVEIQYPDGVTAKFLHMNRIQAGIVPGKSVRAGDVIGESGNTGHSTAPHLHYQLERNGKILDPLDYHGTEPYSLPGDKLAAFQKAREKYSAKLNTKT